MPTKIPQWGKKNIVDPIPIKETVIESIKNKVDFDLKDDLIPQLIETTSRFLSTHEIADKMPRPGQVKAALKTISVNAERAAKISQLIQNLDQLDYLSERSLWRKLEEITSQEPSRWLGNLKEGLKLIGPQIDKIPILHRAAKKASEDLPVDRPGPQKQSVREAYIQGLADIYNKATGLIPTIAQKEGIYYGAFFKFVNICFVEIGEEQHSNQALGSAIQRTLKKPI
jgi:hypothetical protein